MSKLDLPEAEEYTDALAQVMAGGWRQIALGDRLGVPDALGLTTREWVEQRLGGYVRLSMPERREAVRELTEEGMTQREIGDVLGVSTPTVSRDVSYETEEPDEPLPEPTPVSDETRVAALPDDLAARVNEGMALIEAEGVAREREERISAYVARVRKAIDLLARMAGYPIPDDLTDALTDDERAILDAVLSAIPERGNDDRSVAAA